jgi:hypothetical protein
LAHEATTIDVAASPPESARKFRISISVVKMMERARGDPYRRRAPEARAPGEVGAGRRAAPLASGCAALEAP